jgi:hypothetical protein
VKKASEYRKHADECRQMMTAATGEQRAMLEEMARTWDSLAGDRERRATQKQRIAVLEANENRNKRC